MIENLDKHYKWISGETIMQKMQNLLHLNCTGWCGFQWLMWFSSGVCICVCVFVCSCLEKVSHISMVNIQQPWTLQEEINACGALTFQSKGPAYLFFRILEMISNIKYTAVPRGGMTTKEFFTLIFSDHNTTQPPSFKHPPFPFFLFPPNIPSLRQSSITLIQQHYLIPAHFWDEVSMLHGYCPILFLSITSSTSSPHTAWDWQPVSKSIIIMELQWLVLVMWLSKQ